MIKDKLAIIATILTIFCVAGADVAPKPSCTARSMEPLGVHQTQVQIRFKVWTGIFTAHSHWAGAVMVWHLEPSTS
jgi:hypothetical protein